MDIGGSHVSAVLATTRGRVLRASSLPRGPSDGFDATLRHIREVVDNVSSSPPRGNDLAMGVAFPGVLEGRVGEVLFAPNLRGWVGRNAHPALERTLGARVVVENDANCAAWAEHVLGPGRAVGGEHDLLYVVMGTGIGSGLVLHGQVHRGAWGTGGEIGHTQVPGSGRLCGCGNRGCLEAVAGGRALASVALEIAKASPSSGLGRLRARQGALSAWDLLREAEAGDAPSVEARDRAGLAVGGVLGSAVNLLGVPEVVLGGRLLYRAPGLLSAIRKGFREAVLPQVRSRARLRHARGWEHRNAVGAMLLAQLNAQGQSKSARRGRPAGGF